MNQPESEIKDTFCPLPWVHLSMEPTGKVYSCCNTSAEKEIGDIKESNFNDILHGSSNSEVVETFKSGAIPLQCKMCFEEESRGKISLRQSSLRQFPKVAKSSSFSLRYLSLRFDNTCNLKCRTCGPMLSTAWYKDTKSLTGNMPGEKITSFKSEKDFNYFLDNIPSTLQMLYFAGGEPFLTSKFYDVLERLILDQRTDIRILINTNMTELKLKERSAVELLSSFKDVSLDMSIDAIKETGELQRSGMKWKQAEENILFIQKNYPHIKLKIFPTICNLNIFSLKETCNYFLSHSILSCEDIVLNPLTLPEYLCISNVPAELKGKIRDYLYSYMKETLIEWDYSLALPLINQIKGVINLLEKPSNSSYFSEFLSRTKQLDTIRGEKFSRVSPEFASFFTK